MIPILAGWGKDAKQIAYMGIMKCPNCRNYDHFHLYEVTKKASAFFVRVATWGRKYYMICNVCEAALEVNDSEKDEFLRESMDIPTHEAVAAIWAELDETVTRAVEADLDGVQELEKAMAQLTEQHPKQHVEYVSAVFAEYLQDDDQPE